MDFDQFKTTVCGVLDLDPDNLPEGVEFQEYPEQEADGELFDEEFYVEYGGGPVIQYNPEPDYYAWQFKDCYYHTFQALIDANPTAVRVELGLEQPKQSPPPATTHTVDSLAPLFMQSLLSNPELVADTPQVMAANAIAHAEALIRAMGGVAS